MGSQQEWDQCTGFSDMVQQAATTALASGEAALGRGTAAHPMPTLASPHRQADSRDGGYQFLQSHSLQLFAWGLRNYLYVKRCDLAEKSATGCDLHKLVQGNWVGQQSPSLSPEVAAFLRTKVEGMAKSDCIALRPMTRRKHAWG